MQQLQPNNDTGFRYEFNFTNNTATIWFGTVQAGVMFFPYLNTNQMNIEAAIETLRIVEKAFVRYHKRITSRH